MIGCNNSVSLYKDDGTPTGCHLSEFVGTGEEWDSYLTRMSEDWEWGSHIELVALADALGVPILVTTGSCDDNFQVWLYPSVLHTDKVMLLGHSINHYYSLEGKSALYTIILYGRE